MPRPAMGQYFGPDEFGPTAIIEVQIYPMDQRCVYALISNRRFEDFGKPEHIILNLFRQ
jgi:hypothetical protein